MEKRPAPKLNLEDLAQLAGGLDVDDALRERLIADLRADLRFAGHFETLEAMAVEAGTDDLYEGYERHREFENLLTAPDWDDPVEVIYPERDGLCEVDFRQLLAIAEARLAANDEVAPVREVRDRLLRAEKDPARQAVFAVAEALRHLSERTADEVVAEVRRKYWRQPRSASG